MGVRLGEIICTDPALLRQDCLRNQLPAELFYGKANLYRCPLGEEPGGGFVLMTLKDLNSLDFGQPYGLEFSGLAANTFPTVALLQEQTILDAQCVTPGKLDDPAGIYLVEVADVRYHLRRKVIDRAYNMLRTPGPGYLANTLNGGTPWTWAEMLQDLWRAAGVTEYTAWPGLPSALDVPADDPSDFIFWQQSAWAALNFAARRLGCAVQYNPLTHAFALIQVGADDLATLAAHQLWERRRCRLWDDYTQEFVRARYPQYLRVLFRKQPPATQGESPWDYHDCTDPSGTPDGVEPNTYRLLQDDMPSDGVSDTATRATERAADFFRILRQTLFSQRVYSGSLTDFVPGPQVSAVAWEDIGHGPRTTVFRKFLDPGQEWRELRCDSCLGGGGSSNSNTLTLRDRCINCTYTITYDPDVFTVHTACSSS